MELIELEEHKGYSFFVEYVSSLPGNEQWFRVHVSNGYIHNLTIGYSETIDEAKKKVIESFKRHLDNLK